jgi:hypothetical protein
MMNTMLFENLNVIVVLDSSPSKTTNEHDKRALDIITNALESKSIARTDFNIARRAGIYRTATTIEKWLRLNELIASGDVQIIEDGDTAFALALQYDSAGKLIAAGMCSPARYSTLTGANA